MRALSVDRADPSAADRSRSGRQPLLAIHVARTSASRDITNPLTSPRGVAPCSSGVRDLCQSNVSLAVTASGRKVRPLAVASAALRRW